MLDFARWGPGRSGWGQPAATGLGTIPSASPGAPQVIDAARVAEQTSRPARLGAMTWNEMIFHPQAQLHVVQKSENLT